jgi:hypothetical protein
VSEFSVLNALATNGQMGVWVLVALGVIALIRVWPAIGQLRITAAEQKATSDASLRTDLLKRITDLEKGAIDERRLCEEEIRKVRREGEERYDDLREKYDGLMALLRQGSQSNAYLMGAPEKFNEVNEARKQRGEGPVEKRWRDGE